MRSDSDYQLTATEVYPRQELRAFQLSPNGRWLSFLSQRDRRSVEVEEKEHRIVKDTQVADLCLLPSCGGYPRVLTNTGDISNPVSWSSDGNSLLFSQAGELKILTLTETASEGLSIGDLESLCKVKLYEPKLKEEGDAHLSYPRWRPPTDDWLLFASRQEDRTTLRVLSRDGREQRELFSTTGAILGWQWSPPDGTTILFVTRDENSLAGHICLMDFESGRLSQWEEKDYKYQLPTAAWAPSGDSIVFRSNRTGWAKLWAALPDGSAPRPITTGNWDEYSFRFSPDSRHVVFASRSGQVESGTDLWISALDNGEPQLVTQHAGVNIPVAWAANDQIYYWHSSPSEPGELWVTAVDSNDSNKGSRTRLTFSAPAELQRKLRNPEEIIIQNGHIRIPALVYLPADHKEGQKHPAIIWIRGGPTGACRYECKPLYNYLANLGFVIVTPNYRGSTGFGIEHMKAVLSDGVGKNDLSDIAATHKHITEKLPQVDLKRGIGIGGHSWGGYLTLMAVTSEETCAGFSCAVAGAAISDWLIQQAQTEVRSYDHWLMGGWVYEQEERARTRSPANFVEQIRVPLLIYHGELDRDVPFSQIKAFVRKARDAGVSIDQKFYPAEEHNLKKLENQEHNLRLVGDFFRRHLQHWNFRDNPCADQVT